MNLKTGRVLFAAMAAVTFVRCTPGPIYQNLQIHDIAAMPEVRVSKSFHSSDHTDAAFEFGLSRPSGSSDLQGLGPDQVRLGGVTFNPPPVLSSNSSLTMYDGSVRWRQFFGDLPFGYEISGGLGYADLNLALSSPTLQTSESITSPAFRIRIAGTWRISPRTRVEAGATLLTPTSVFDNFSGVDVSLARTLSHHAAVRGGYSSWHLHSPEASRSEIDLRFSGPSIGLSLNF